MLDSSSPDTYEGSARVSFLLGSLVYAVGTDDGGEQPGFKLQDQLFRTLKKHTCRYAKTSRSFPYRSRLHTSRRSLLFPADVILD